ncbi:sensor histidine kinase [Ponticaulis profundi]|uniref:histidine kinase n=1 Tax=Ponticaulis profundi TaxID=2665222 RepID=A0ABW1S850_9PROT
MVFSRAGAPDAWLKAIIQSSNDAIISKTLDGIITSWNPAAQRIFGYTEEEMVGTSIRKLVPERLQHEEDEILAAIHRNEQVPHFETFRLHKSGREVPITVTISPIRDDTGAVIGASKIARDSTPDIEARRRILESETRFQTLADNISQLAWMADETGWIFWYNKRWFDYTGTTLEDMEGWGWKKVHHPDFVDDVAERIQHSWDTGEDWEDTFPLRGKDGEFRWFLSRAHPIRDKNGRILRWFGTNTDITEEKERQEQIKFLMHEVNHRSKNMLALVQGIARQTSKGGNEAFLKAFSSRIRSLSASQGLLLEEGWKGASIRSLIRSQLGHLEDLMDERIHIDGKSVNIDAASAQTLGMVLHELSTNAGKYGALSNDSGEVHIKWELVPSGSEKGDQLSLSWTESGGPPVTPPDHKGFGTVVIERMCRSAFGGDVILDYRPEGLHWSLLGAPGKGLAPDPSEADNLLQL